MKFKASIQSSVESYFIYPVPVISPATLLFYGYSAPARNYTSFHSHFLRQQFNTNEGIGNLRFDAWQLLVWRQINLRIFRKYEIGLLVYAYTCEHLISSTTLPSIKYHLLNGFRLFQWYAFGLKNPVSFVKYNFHTVLSLRTYALCFEAKSYSNGQILKCS